LYLTAVVLKTAHTNFDKPKMDCCYFLLPQYLVDFWHKLLKKDIPFQY